MVEFVRLKDIREEVFKRSTLLAIPDLSDLMNIGGKYSPDQIMGMIIKNALKDFEDYHPLVQVFRHYLNINPEIGWYEFVDNFQIL